jgi:hypothetical protein
MSSRFLILERVAFALFTFSAIADAAYISYEKSPNFRENMQEIVKAGTNVSYANAGDGFEPVPMALN